MELTVKTDKERQVVDITTWIEELVRSQHKLVNIFAAHTTCAITTADLDPGTDLDMLEAFWGMIPKLNFRHPHDPAHAPAHIASSIIGPGVSVPANEGKLLLGTWQRIVLVELDGPKERKVIVSLS
jgi:secondary thiamine-phosphate synthase enzyme